jgi:O-antigen/teichoic acid export membrane protein
MLTLLFSLKLFERIKKIIFLIKFSPFDISSEEGRSKERYRLIALSGSSSIITKFITSLMGLISVPLTINYLGKEQFGLWMIISSLIVWVQLADFGISNGLVNALSEANGKDDRAAACSYVSTAIIAVSFVAIICVIPVIILSYNLPWCRILNFQDPSLNNIAIYCFLFAGLIFVLNLPLSIVNRIFIAYQLGYITNLLQVFSSFITLTGLCIAIFFKLSLPILVIFISLGPVVGNLFSWLILKKKIKWLRFEKNKITSKALKRVAVSSVPMFFYISGSMLTSQVINIIIAQVGTLSMVADYNILWKIYITIFTLGISFSAPFYPAIREAYERKEIVWVNKSIQKVILIRLFVIGVPAIFLLLWGDQIVKLWIRQPLTNPFGFAGWLSFFICMVLYAYYSTLSEILVSLDKIWSQNLILISCTIISLIGSYILVPVYGLKAYYIVSCLSIILPIFYSMYSIRKWVAPFRMELSNV